MGNRATGPERALNGRRWAVLVSVVVMVGVGALLFLQHSKEISATRTRGEGEMDDLFKLLTDRGYLPNRSLSGAFLPGTILQTRESRAGSDDVPMDPPLTMFWPDRCFPGLEIRDTSFALPDRQGSAHSSLSLGAESVRRMFPSLALGHAAAVDYRIQIFDPRMRLIAKGDVSEKLAPNCVTDLAKELKAGAKAEWFAVVMETVRASRLSFHTTWSRNASASERLEVRTELAGKLAVATSGADGGVASASLVQDGRDEMVLEIGDVTLGYRLRELEEIPPTPDGKTSARLHPPEKPRP